MYMFISIIVNCGIIKILFKPIPQSIESIIFFNKLQINECGPAWDHGEVIYTQFGFVFDVFFVVVVLFLVGLRA